MNPRFPLQYLEASDVPSPDAVIGAQPFGRARTFRQRVGCALAGLRAAWRTEPHLRLHAGLGAATVAGGCWMQLSVMEWLWVTFAIGLVIFAELMNTAIEQTVDLVVGLRSDPLARHVKDLAAGCVLVAALIAAAVGLLVFIPGVVAR